MSTSKNRRFFMQKMLLGLLASLSFFTASAQQLTADQAREDLRFLRQKLEAWYPGLGYYTPRDVFEKRLDSIASNWTQFIDYQQFYRDLSPVRELLKDGHFGIYHRKKWATDSTKFLPFQVRTVGSKYLVILDFTADSLLPRGTEIVAVSGKPVAELDAFFIQKYRDGNDGDNRSGSRTRTMLNFAGYHFDWFGSVDSVEISFRLTDSSAVETRKMACTTDKQRTQVLGKRYPKLPKTRPNLNFEIIDSLKNTAILTVSTFSHQKKGDILGRNFSRKLKRAFHEAKAQKIEHLIIDLRSNGGGSVSNSGRLLSYLLPEPFDIFSDGRLTRRGQWPYMLAAPNPFTWFFFLGEHRRDHETGGWRDRKHRKPAWKPKKKLGFRGQTWFLMNGASYSAAVSVLAIAQNRGIGKFVGEPTGGAIWGDFAARFKMITLPNSKIRVRIPLKKLDHDVDLSRVKTFVVEPDFPMERSREDLMQVRDFMLPRVIELIQNDKK